MRSYSTVDPVDALEQVRNNTRPAHAASLLRVNLVILGELSDLPCSPAGGALLCQLPSGVVGTPRKDQEQP